MAGTNPSDSLSSRPSDNRGTVSLPRHRAMPPGERSVPVAVERLAVVTAAADTLPCLNPVCPGHGSKPRDRVQRSGECTWPAKGRPSYFCCSACREQYDYGRTQLAEDIAALDEALSVPGGTYRDRRRVETELAKRRWAMQRYVLDSAQLAPGRKRKEGSS